MVMEFIKRSCNLHLKSAVADDTFTTSPATQTTTNFTGLARPPPPSRNKYITITIRAPTGRSQKIKIRGADTVTMLIALIAMTMGTPPEDQQLVFEGVHLNERATIEHYSIWEGATIDLLIRRHK